VGWFSTDPRYQRREEEGVFSVHDWAEVCRLYHREHLSKSAIAKRLGMSRPTVNRLLEHSGPPRYARRSAGSKLDPHRDAIASTLDADPRVSATVVLEHLRRDGYAGGITILKEHLAEVRPQFLAARSFQRTTYLPGELAHGDWWELPIEVRSEAAPDARPTGR
jgi:transposase